MTPAPSTRAGRSYEGFVLLCAVVLLVVGALLYAVFTSAWGPWIVGTAAVAIIVVVGSIPAAVAVGWVLVIHPQSRAQLLDRRDQHLERRHQERLVASTAPPSAQHLHIGPGVELPSATRYRD